MHHAQLSAERSSKGESNQTKKQERRPTGVVNDAALLVGEDRQGAGAVGQALDVSNHKRLQEGNGVLALHNASRGTRSSTQLDRHGKRSCQPLGPPEGGGVCALQRLPEEAEHAASEECRKSVL